MLFNIDLNVFTVLADFMKETPKARYALNSFHRILY